MHMNPANAAKPHTTVVKYDSPPVKGCTGYVTRAAALVAAPVRIFYFAHTMHARPTPHVMCFLFDVLACTPPLHCTTVRVRIFFAPYGVIYPMADFVATGPITALRAFPKWGWVAIGIAVAVVVLIIVVAAAASTATVSSAITTTDPGLVEDPPLSGGGVDDGNAAEDLTAVETPAPTSCFEWASWVPNAVDGVPSWVVGNVGTYLAPVASTGTSGSPSLGATNRSQTADDFGEFFSYDPLLDSWTSLYAAKATADCPGVSTFTQTDDVDEALKFMDVPVCYDFSGVSTAFSPYVNGACTQWPYMGQFALVKNTTA